MATLISLDIFQIIFGALVLGIGSGIGTTLGKEMYEHFKSKSKKIVNGSSI